MDKKDLMFQGDIAFLSNMYIAPFEYMGIEYQCSEYYYQSCKTDDPAEKQYILSAPTPHKAKKRSKKVQLRPNWKKDRVQYMMTASLLKYRSHPKLFRKLCAIVGPIVEYNYWHDNFWGDCFCELCKKIVGRNELGRILMSLKFLIK